jgi:hypothetical protein
VNDDARIPEQSAILEPLVTEDLETKDVMALVGFVGPGREGNIRLYPDVDCQRWMDVAQDEIVANSPLHAGPTGRLERRIVWVNREWMLDDVFKENVFQDIQNNFAGSWISIWPLIPGSRYVAAQMLDLLPRLTHGENREGGYG